MKYLKILGLAAVAAAALMAFAGAGTASATTTLCKATEDACSTANMYPENTEIHAVLKEGTKAVLTGSEELPPDECTSSTLKGTTETTTTPEGPVSELTWGGCSFTTNTVAPGRLTVHWDAAHNGTLTATAKVTLSAFFNALHCIYGGEVKEGLTLTGGAPASVDATAKIPLVESTGGIECPKFATWHAEYVITSPSPLYVSPGV